MVAAVDKRDASGSAIGNGAIMAPDRFVRRRFFVIWLI
jgi:hypothetical protein